jgi:protocatechuate 3,4-dioxygenase beta subunit
VTNLATRRKWLLFAGGGAPLLASRSSGAGVGGKKPVTPEQPEGPFYRVADQTGKQVDLTRVDGVPGRARGTIVHLHGSVRTVYGAPIPGALVEIWQACASGRYDHPDDDTPAPLDPCFLYWGRAITGDRGGYGFVTVKPGAHADEQGRMRPPHIHVHVVAPGFHSLTTQIYFAGEPLNGADGVLAGVPREQRRLLAVAFAPIPNLPGHVTGSFDIVLGAPSQGATPETR